MLIFTEKTAPVKIKPGAKLPYVDDALETLAELVASNRNSTSLNRKAYLAVFNALSGHSDLDDKGRALVLDIIQGWDELQA